MSSQESIEATIRQYFSTKGIEIAALSTRRFPSETIFVVEVMADDYKMSVEAAAMLDLPDDNALVTVRKATSRPEITACTVNSIADQPIATLIELLSTRARTSEQQPSLRYVKDAAENLSLVTSRRHHLIFGRRGVGKTALMVEAKKIAEGRGDYTFWQNLQTIRRQTVNSAFLTVSARLCDLPKQVLPSGRTAYQSAAKASNLLARIQEEQYKTPINTEVLSHIVPELQYILRLLSEETQSNLFIFIDDFHYLDMKDQPFFLDLLHGVTRDSNVWLKIAGIKHQSRWFTDNPPAGLQTGHDASIIDLDVTLENPTRAREFLWKIFQTYVDEAGIGNISKFISAKAIDRLVLAAGGVPRDFLALGSTAIRLTRSRSGRQTGVQDVNEVAGEAANLKIQELEDDAASSIGSAKARIDALNKLRKFLIEEKQFTFFRIDFRDKEENPERYSIVQSLMDLRIIHIIKNSLSDAEEAGRKFEVYMLDLSQFSGSRIRRKLSVLDFEKSVLIFRKTGTADPVIRGEFSRDINSILRRGPIFELQDLGA